MDTKKLISDITAELKKHSDPEYKILTRVFMKFSTNIFIGARNPFVHTIAKKYYNVVKSKPFDEQLVVCFALLDTKVHELKSIAFDWLHNSRKQFREKDVKIFFVILKKYIEDWADCDDFSTHVLGDYFLMYPGNAKEVLSWCTSKNRWVKRGAAVSLIYPLKRGGQLSLAFEVADALLTDTDDMVQKGYGWMLKEASKNFQMEVFLYVMSHKDEMPRTALRYAIEKMPDELKKEAMKRT